MPEMKSLTLNDKTYDCFVDSVARSQAAWSAVVDSASGENIVTSAASNFNFMGLHIFGKTTQNGTPTPDAPVDMVNIGDSGSITVNVVGTNETQRMSITAPNGLPGIKVASGGNYTDATGQQWICDEIDFTRGVSVQRVGVKTFDGTENWFYATDANYFSIYHSALKSTDIGLPLCSHFSQEQPRVSGTFFAGTSGFAFYYSVTSTNEWKAFLSQQLSNGTPVKLLYILSTPVETPLSEEEIAAYADLHTYKDYTKVSNDAGAWMDLEYVMDARKYIDSQISAGILNATVEE